MKNIFLALLLFAPFAFAGWFDTSWYYSRPILVNSTVSNNALYYGDVNLTTLTLLSNSCGELRFTTSDNATIINYSLVDNSGQAAAQGSRWCNARVNRTPTAGYENVTAWAWYGNSGAAAGNSSFPYTTFTQPDQSNPTAWSFTSNGTALTTSNATNFNVTLIASTVNATAASQADNGQSGDLLPGYLLAQRINTSVDRIVGWWFSTSKNTGNTNDTVVQLQGDNSTGWPAKPNGTVLATATIPAANITASGIQSSYAPLEFYDLAAGTSYWVVGVGSVGAGGANRSLLYEHSAGGYGGDWNYYSYSLDSGSTWAVPAGSYAWDMGFTWYYPQFTTTPYLQSSNDSKVFDTAVFREEFGGTTLDTTKWWYETLTTYAVPVIGSGVVNNTATKSYAISTINTTNYTYGEVTFNATFSNAGTTNTQFVGFFNNGNRWALVSNYDATEVTARVSGGIDTQVNIGALYNQSHEYKISWYPDKVKFYVDGLLKTTITTSIPNIPLAVEARNDLTTTGLIVDYLRVNNPFSNGARIITLANGSGSYDYAYDNTNYSTVVLNTSHAVSRFYSPNGFNFTTWKPTFAGAASYSTDGGLTYFDATSATAYANNTRSVMVALNSFASNLQFNASFSNSSAAALPVIVVGVNNLTLSQSTNSSTQSTVTIGYFERLLSAYWTGTTSESNQSIMVVNSSHAYLNETHENLTAYSVMGFTPSHAVLSTNESGTWVNHTTAYGSPVALTDLSSLFGFSWYNASFINETLFWRVWANNSAGAWNDSGVQNFEYAKVLTTAISTPGNDTPQSNGFNLTATATGVGNTYVCWYTQNSSTYLMANNASNTTSAFTAVSSAAGFYYFNVTCSNQRGEVKSSNLTSTTYWYDVKEQPGGHVGGGGGGGGLMATPTPSTTPTLATTETAPVDLKDMIFIPFIGLNISLGALLGLAFLFFAKFAWDDDVDRSAGLPKMLYGLTPLVLLAVGSYLLVTFWGMEAVVG